MAADGFHSCNLRWTIYHPFIPWRSVYALFFDGTPNPTQWKAAILPLNRGIATWGFLFSLEYLGKIEEAVEAREVSIRIFLNNALIEERIGTDFTFYPTSEYVYRFVTRVFMTPQMGLNSLTFEIALRLPENRRNEFNYNPPLQESDAQLLSIDLNNLLNDPVHSNMRLRSIDGRTTRVHSYIIYARWTKMGSIPPKDEQLDAIQLDIGYDVLCIILIYLYSGRLDTGWPGWSNLFYVSQVYHVIYFYGIDHLYRVLVNNDVEQRQDIIREAVSQQITIESDALLSLPNTGIIVRNLNLNTWYHFFFVLQVHDDYGRWLSYSLISQSLRSVFVQVSLEVIEERLKPKTQIPLFQHIRYLYERDHLINPTSKESTEPILFLQSPQILGNLHTDDSNITQRETSFFIRCTLKFTDGTEIYQIRSISGNRQEYPECCTILCDHMETLFEEIRDEADLRIVAFRGLPNQRNRHEIEEADVYMTYKAIFEARVPNWRRVFENIRAENAMLTEVTSSLISEAIPLILSYICTARVTAIPRAFLDQIEDFARRGRCQALVDLVVRARSYPPVIND